MYKSFRVKNFRCFKDLQINDLGRVNLIAGKNNTGKTASDGGDVRSILVAVDPKILLREKTHFRYRQCDEIMYDKPQSSMNWSSIFSNLDTSRSVEMSASESIIWTNATTAIHCSR